jgi:hypothetical protein
MSGATAEDKGEKYRLAKLTHWTVAVAESATGVWLHHLRSFGRGNNGACWMNSRPGNAR